MRAHEKKPCEPIPKNPHDPRKTPAPGYAEPKPKPTPNTPEKPDVSKP